MDFKELERRVVVSLFNKLEEVKTSKLKTKFIGFFGEDFLPCYHIKDKWLIIYRNKLFGTFKNKPILCMTKEALVKENLL